MKRFLQNICVWYLITTVSMKNMKPFYNYRIKKVKWYYNGANIPVTICKRPVNAPRTPSELLSNVPRSEHKHLVNTPCSKLDKFWIDLLRILIRLQFELVPRVCAVEQLLELGVRALGFPLPFFGGLMYSVALTNSLAASSGCGQLPDLGRLWRYGLINLVLGDNLNNSGSTYRVTKRL